MWTAAAIEMVAAGADFLTDTLHGSIVPFAAASSIMCIATSKILLSRSGSPDRNVGQQAAPPSQPHA